jgi:hypothetical protein
VSFRKLLNTELKMLSANDTAEMVEMKSAISRCMERNLRFDGVCRVFKRGSRFRKKMMNHRGTENTEKEREKRVSYMDRQDIQDKDRCTMIPDNCPSDGSEFILSIYSMPVISNLRFFVFLRVLCASEVNVFRYFTSP